MLDKAGKEGIRALVNDRGCHIDPGKGGCRSDSLLGRSHPIVDPGSGKKRLATAPDPDEGFEILGNEPGAVIRNGARTRFRVLFLGKMDDDLHIQTKIVDHRQLFCGSVVAR